MRLEAQEFQNWKLEVSVHDVFGGALLCQNNETRMLPGPLLQQGSATYYENHGAISFSCTVGCNLIVIYLGKLSNWARNWPWAVLRRDEILTRIAMAVVKPGYVADIHADLIVVRKP